MSLMLIQFHLSSLINLTFNQVPSYYPLLAASNEVLPKLYAVSMMWTLNARQDLRGLPWGNSSTLSYINSGKKPQWNTRGSIQVEPVCLYLVIHRGESELCQLSNDVQAQGDAHVEVGLFWMCVLQTYLSLRILTLSRLGGAVIQDMDRLFKSRSLYIFMLRSFQCEAVSPIYCTQCYCRSAV